MYNLYLKNRKGKLIAAKEKPFQTEEEFEKYLFDTKELFLDIFFLKRQVNSGKDIPDVIGIDRDNNIVIIENKNTTVSEEILPQILRYAIWARTNPDSIKALWLETKDRPEDIEVEWDNVDIRIIILAPAIKLSVQRLLKTINESVELIEVKRFLIGNEEVILLNKLEEEPEKTTRTVRGMEVYDKEFYKKVRNNKSVDLFFKVADEVNDLVKRKKWPLERKFNKYYIGFKYGFPNVFGIEWVGTKSLKFFFRIPASKFQSIKKLSPYNVEYDERWKQAIIRFDDNVNIKSLEPVFEVTYNLFMEK